MTETESLKAKLEIAKSALLGVLNSAVEPNRAKSASMVNLAPIRAALAALDMPTVEDSEECVTYAPY